MYGLNMEKLWVCALTSIASLGKWVFVSLGDVLHTEKEIEESTKKAKTFETY